MGGVNRGDQESKPTGELDRGELAELTKKPDELVVDGFDPPTFRMASGTTPPLDQEVVARSRTTTAHDPLTTSLLAEVARRTQTMDEIELGAEAEADERKADDEPAPPASPRLIRRR